MSVQIEQSVVQQLRLLPPEKQQEVLDFVEFLRQRASAQETATSYPRRTVRELQIDTDVDISEEDIAEARREMWGRFPREDV